MTRSFKNVRRPWKVAFTWTNTNRSTSETFATPIEAVRDRAQLLELSEDKGHPLTVTITNTETGAMVPMPPHCQHCGTRYAHPDATTGVENLSCRPCRDLRNEAAQQRRLFVEHAIHDAHRAHHHRITDTPPPMTPPGTWVVAARLSNPVAGLLMLTATRRHRAGHAITVTAPAFTLDDAETSAELLHDLTIRANTLFEGEDQE